MDRHRQRVGNRAGLPDEVRQPAERRRLPELVAQLPIAVERLLLLGLGTLEVGHEIALGRSALAQLRPGLERQRVAVGQRPLVQRRPLAMGAEPAGAGRGRCNEAHHLVRVAAAVGVVGQAGEIRLAPGRLRQRQERGVVQLALLVIADRGGDRLARQLVTER